MKKKVETTDHPKNRDLNAKQMEYREIILKHMNEHILLNYNNNKAEFCRKNSMTNNRSALSAFFNNGGLPMFTSIQRWMEATNSHIELVWKDLGKRQLLTPDFYQLSPFYEIWLHDFETLTMDEMTVKYGMCDHTLLEYRPKPNLEKLENPRADSEFYTITRILAGMGVDIEIKPGEFITLADPDELVNQLDELEETLKGPLIGKRGN